MRVERCYRCENLKFIMGRPQYTSDLPVIEGYECKESGVKVSHEQGEGELVKSCPLLPLKLHLSHELTEAIRENVYYVIRDSELLSDPFETGDLTDSVVEIVRQVIEEGGIL